MANANEKSAEKTEPQKIVTRFIIVHGDKGGVGKSFVAQAIVDYLIDDAKKVTVIDTDMSNPDVARMFGNLITCNEIDIRNENGWMDVMDFVIHNPNCTIVMNTPAGIGQFMKTDLESFTSFLAEQNLNVEFELWWTMNVQHDSVNLLDYALNKYGHFFKRIRVVCNLHFANGNKSENGPFFLWNESSLRTKVEKNGGLTIFFPGLHLRVVSKLFDPKHIMSFGNAEDAALGEIVGLEHSERWKLQQWRIDIKKIFDVALKPAITSAKDITNKAK
jgi:hypothetical protein